MVVPEESCPGSRLYSQVPSVTCPLSVSEINTILVQSLENNVFKTMCLIIYKGVSVKHYLSVTDTTEVMKSYGFSTDVGSLERFMTVVREHTHLLFIGAVVCHRKCGFTTFLYGAEVELHGKIP